MTEPNGHVCPECAAPRTPDGTPSCACTRRASDALRDARTAEAAAAEDFDPLRIRPYVDLTANETAPSPSPATMRLRTVPSEALSAVRHVASGNEPPYPPPEPAPLPLTEEPPRRRRRTALLAATGAAVAVVAAAGFASGLFSYDAPARDRALPDDVRASVPDPTPTSPPPSPSPRSGSGSGSGSAPESAASPTTTATTTVASSPSPSGSPSPSASATRSQPSTASPSPTPTPTAAASLAPGQGSTGDQPAQTLRRGDQGPEVTELQLRLRQLSLYTGKTDGTYSGQVEDAVRRYQWARGITGDKSGVYGAATRASLEGETRTP
ncbi:peptidoglycan-binding domain-containing protein [Streptomyces mirabilis]|uniref:Putative peptidoglycan binding domain-containing protein n=1 Tax=Streptomyces mirabilis TaxID=68239 RepID=A0A1I2DL35_9ACTN|nr:peptidoglycan-binding domain-containing protein [Streptomyces mirabilis]SFE80993.1 Putative peptidoglycan binding domain-containing protein [Streptomyces mirabilis]